MSTVTLLRSNPNFLRYWSAGLISNLGSAVSGIAVPLLALAMGAGVTRAGVIGSAALAARLLCRFPAGQLADRYDRRWLMLSSDLFRAVLLSSIPLAAVWGGLHFMLLLVVAVADAASSAVFSATNAIALRDVVSDQQMTDALSTNQATGSTVLLLGPALGGLLFGIDRIAPFAVDSVSYLISAVLLFGISVRPPASSGRRDRRMLAGMHWLRGQPGLLWVLAFASVINLIGSTLEIGLVVSLRAQGAAGSTVGVVIAFVGAGSVVGALLAPRLIATLPAGPLFLVTGLIWTVGLAVIAARPGIIAVCAVMMVLVIFIPAGMILLGKAVLVSCPREILARVNTAIGTGLMALASLGPILIGVAISTVGIYRAWLVLAGLALLISVVACRPLLRLSSLVAEDPVEQPVSSPEPEQPLEAQELTLEFLEAAEFSEELAGSRIPEVVAHGHLHENPDESSEPTADGAPA